MKFPPVAARSRTARWERGHLLSTEPLLMKNKLKTVLEVGKKEEFKNPMFIVQ